LRPLWAGGGASSWWPGQNLLRALRRERQDGVGAAGLEPGENGPGLADAPTPVAELLRAQRLTLRHLGARGHVAADLQLSYSDLAVVGSAHCTGSVGTFRRGDHRE